MDIHKLSPFLKQQHHHIDDGIQAVATDNGNLAALRESLTLLRLHLYVEEHWLFPPLVASGLTMPVFVMKREHGQMWPLLQRLVAGCATGQCVDALRGDCQGLLQLLQVHNPKEETIVYAAVDRLAVTQGTQDLVDTLAAARVPKGWVCEMAPP